MPLPRDAEWRALVSKAFAELILALPHRWKTTSEKAAAMKVYWEDLQSLSPEAVVAGARALRVDGTSDNWFPTPAEWFDAAAEFELHRLDAAPVAGLLTAATASTEEEELASACASRDALVQECRDLGRDGLAEFFENQVVTHPSRDTSADARFCLECADSGRRPVEGGFVECHCLEHNPKLRAIRLRHRVKSRLERRRHRAAVLNPRRGSMTALAEIE